MLFEAGGELVALGLLHRDEVLDADRIEELPAEPLGRDAGADSLARRIDRGRGTRGSAADHQHIVRGLRREALGLAFSARRIELRDDVLERHAALPERLTVQEHGGHRHDAPALDLVLEQRAVDHGMPHVRVQHRHEIQRLNHIGAVLAAQRNERLEAQPALEPPHLIHDRRVGLRRMAADLQEREHQRAELVPQGQSGETHPRLLAGRPQGERRRKLAVVALGRRAAPEPTRRRCPRGARASPVTHRRHRAMPRSRPAG